MLLKQVDFRYGDAAAETNVHVAAWLPLPFM